MIVVTIKMTVRPEKSKELVQTVCALMALARKERGCLASEFYLNVENENALCLLEEWESQENLDDHLRSRNFTVLLGTGQLLSEPLEMKFHLVSHTVGEEAVEAGRKEGNG